MRLEVVLWAMPMTFFIAVIVFFVAYRLIIKVIHRREFKRLFGVALKHFGVERVVREKLASLEGGVRNQIMEAVEVFKPLSSIDISSSDTDFLFAMWKEQTEIVQRKAKELERARIIAEKFAFKLD